MRKSRKNLTNKEIEKAFLKDASPSGIIAVYMYKKSEPNIVNVMMKQEMMSHDKLEGTSDLLDINQPNKISMIENIHDKRLSQQATNDDDNQVFFEYLDKEGLSKYIVIIRG
jgi:hypothetical protein